VLYYKTLLVEFDDEDNKSNVQLEDPLDFESLEKKYTAKLKQYHGSDDEKSLIMHIFPNFDVSDIRKCRVLENEVMFSISKIPGIDNFKIHITGEVKETLGEEGRLIKEVFDTGWVSIITICIILMIFYFRIPLGPILALLPLAMGITWTLALAYLFIGHLTMITLSLGIILLGLGLDAALHLLARYVEERRKNLSAEIAFETIILETGPAISTGALTSAAAFFAITITEFKGFYEFGLIAGLGMVCTMVAILLIFPALLILLEKHHLVVVFGPSKLYQNQFVRSPFTRWKLNAALLAFITIICLPMGIQSEFEYNFDKLQFPNQNTVADSILLAAGEELGSPTVIISSTPEEAAQLTKYIWEYMAKDTITPTIHTVLSFEDMLPTNQEEKLLLIESIKQMVTPEIISKADSVYKKALTKLKNSWDVTKLKTSDLPINFQNKFVGKNSEPGNFTFIFPSIDLNNGLNCIAFAEDTRKIKVNDSTVYYTSGIAVVYSDLLELMKPDTLKALCIALFTVLLLIYYDTKSFRATLLVFCPLVLGILWTLGLMKLFGIKINHFNLVVLPAMIGIGIDNSVHIYHRYLEEGLGSLHFVVKKTGTVVLVTSLTSLAGFFGLAFSSHQGLYSMGITAIIGITTTFIASILFVPMLLGILDINKMKQTSSTKTLS